MRLFRKKNPLPAGRERAGNSPKVAAWKKQQPRAQPAAAGEAAPPARSGVFNVEVQHKGESNWHSVTANLLADNRLSFRPHLAAVMPTDTVSAPQPAWMYLESLIGPTTCRISDDVQEVKELGSRQSSFQLVLMGEAVSEYYVSGTDATAFREAIQEIIGDTTADTGGGGRKRTKRRRRKSIGRKSRRKASKRKSRRRKRAAWTKRR